MILVPFSTAAFEREIDFYVEWFNAHRPHGWLGGRTPDEAYYRQMPACRKPRFEPRSRWPRRSPCALPQALVRGRPGVLVELRVGSYARRKHLSLVTLKQVA